MPPSESEESRSRKGWRSSSSPSSSSSWLSLIIARDGVVPIPVLFGVVLDMFEGCELKRWKLERQDLGFEDEERWVD